jgi:transcription initiation factor IIF auxiliary subunit
MLVKIMVRNTSQRLITHLSEQHFQWSVFIETEPNQFRKEIKKVIYHLHPTFPNKDVVKTNESEGFVLNAQGWGEFIITVELVLYDDRRLIIEHYLSLFSKNQDGNYKDSLQEGLFIVLMCIQPSCCPLLQMYYNSVI